MVIFLLAGHEVGILHSPGGATRTVPLLQTTAHTLCFAFALLALYPDEQERLYQHIKGIMADLDGMPVRPIISGLKLTKLTGELTSRRPMKT
jgi:hypothetical protein